MPAKPIATKLAITNLENESPQGIRPIQFEIDLFREMHINF